MNQKRSMMRRILGLLLALCVVLPVWAPMSQAAENKLPFTDVREKSWICREVSYAYFNGLVDGVTATTFKPNRSVTRAEFVTILGRIFVTDPAAYTPQEDEQLFQDVKPGKYYTPYVLWATRNGVTRGLTQELFGVDRPITRQDAITMIARSQILADESRLQPNTDEVIFKDETSVSAYAKAAVRLLQQQGIVTGSSDGKLYPKRNITRAEAAALLGRYHARLQAHTHSYQSKTIHSATCRWPAVVRLTCSCGSYYEKDTGKALGHTYQMTGYSADRKEIHVCSRCKDTYYIPLPAAKQLYSGDSLLRYEQICTVLNSLAERYPDLITLQTAGKSLNGVDIPIVHMGKGNRYIFLNGNLHAREYITTNYLLEVMDEYAYAWATDGKIGSYRIKPLLEDFTLVMLPCANPDGRAIAIEKKPQYKNNARNVNLNANFPTNWKYNASGENGLKAGSEPETQIMMQALNQHPFELVLDCHTAGNVIYYADYDCSSELAKRSRSLADAMIAESGYLPYLYNATAGFANYARHPYGCIGFTVEMWPTLEHPIDCTGFYTKIWNRLSTMPAIAMTWLTKNG